MIRRQLHHIWRRLAPFELDWVQVEVSARCDAACGYCPVTCYGEKRRGGLMGEDVFDRLLPSVGNVGLVFLQGWGEPLTNPRFFDMAERVRAAGTRVGFTTNALRLDGDRRERLLASGIDIVGVSLAGAATETHERFREGCDLDVVSEHLLALKEEKERAGLDRPEVHLAYMTLASNFRELTDLVSLAERWGASNVVASHLSLVATEGLEEECLPNRPELREEFETEVERAREAAGSRGIVFHAYPLGSGVAAPICTENVLRSCFVTADGDVVPCAMKGLGFRSGVEPVVFGNLRDAMLEEIWRSGPARAFREAFEDRVARNRTGGEGLPGPCRGCLKITGG